MQRGVCISLLMAGFVGFFRVFVFFILLALVRRQFEKIVTRQSKILVKIYRQL